MTTAMKETANRELSISRLLNAPRELVWEVWTRPEHLTHWWGPVGFSTTTHEMDLKPGGVWRFMMHGPDGRNYPNKVVFIKVIKPEFLEYNHSGEEEMEDVKFHVTVQFEKKGNKTQLTMSSLFETPEELEKVVREFGAKEGMYQTVSRLEEFLEKINAGPSKQEPFTIERVYNAPVDRVWNAITNRAEMKQWYFDLAEFKPVVGFEFQFYGQGLKGEQYLHHCRVTEVVTQKKISYSWQYESYDGYSLVTFELFGEGDQTRLKLTHAGLESFPAGNPDFAKENFAMGWTELTGTLLKNYLENRG